MIGRGAVTGAGLAVCAVAVWALLRVGAAAAQVDATALEAQGAIKDIRRRAARAADVVEAYNGALLGQLQDPKTQRALGLLLRSGDDLARGVKRLNVTLEELQDAIRETKGNFANVAGEARGLIGDARSEVARIGADGSAAIRDVAGSAKAATAAMEQTAARLDDTLAGIRRLTADTNAVVADPQVGDAIYHINHAAALAEITAGRAEAGTRPLAAMAHGVGWFFRKVAGVFR